MITATITGNVGRPPESRVTGSGKTMASFSVASTVKSKSGESQTTWVDVVCFDEQADVVVQHARKGERVIVTGRMGLEQYTRKDGTSGSSLRMIADEVGISLRWPKKEHVPSNGELSAEEEAAIQF
jgi:single-strand DNA-binding protein